VIDERSSSANAVHFNPIWQPATPSVINAKCSVPRWPPHARQTTRDNSQICSKRKRDSTWAIRMDRTDRYTTPLAIDFQKLRAFTR
jgi:hypothetical protein